MDLNTYQNQIPHDIGSAVRNAIRAGEHFLPGLGEPWVSVGGGYGRFRESPAQFYNPNPGFNRHQYRRHPVRCGLGCLFWSKWAPASKPRFYSGLPDYDVTTNASRQHNFYVGAGVMHRF